MKKKSRNRISNSRHRNTDNIHAGHRQRLRKLFLTTHPSALSDHQLLELLLFYAIPRADTNITAHLLLETFGSITGILGADINHLIKVDGIGEKSALLIKMILELMRRANIENEKEIIL